MSTPEFNGRRALVVEDQEAFRDAITFELESLGFAVTTANEGGEGYQRASAEAFDLILSDIKMPNWDGKRMLEELHKDDKPLPPFAFMTGFADLTIQDAYDMGADAFLGKPSSAEKIHETITELLAQPEVRWSKRAEPKLTAHIGKSLRGWNTPDALDECAIGRRGMFLAIDASVVLKPEDRVSFSLAFDDGPLGTLTGIGRIAWVRKAGPATAGAVGVTFEFLDDPGRTTLVQYLRSTPQRAAIPLRRGAVR